MAASDDDDIPELHDIVRPGAGASGQRQQGDARTPALTEDEIEAIAARVIERYSEHLEQAIARAIAAALQAKGRPRSQDQDDEGGG